MSLPTTSDMPPSINLKHLVGLDKDLLISIIETMVLENIRLKDEICQAREQHLDHLFRIIPKLVPLTLMAANEQADEATAYAVNLTQTISTMYNDTLAT